MVIASKDGRGRVTVFHALRLDAGRQELPGSVELDDALGRERVIAAFSDRPVRLDQVRAALERDRPVPGAKTFELEILKVPR